MEEQSIKNNNLDDWEEENIYSTDENEDNNSIELSYKSFIISDSTDSTNLINTLDTQFRTELLKESNFLIVSNTSNNSIHIKPTLNERIDTLYSELKNIKEEIKNIKNDIVLNITSEVQRLIREELNEIKIYGEREKNRYVRSHIPFRFIPQSSFSVK